MFSMASYRVSLVTFSSSRTVEKPCFSKDRAFKIWSPRLAAAESGIKMFGFLRARISQMEFAPARDRMMSAAANRWRSGSVYVFVLYTSRAADEAFIQMAFPADM